MNVKVKMFADNCVLYTEGLTWDFVRKPLQDALNVYMKWDQKNCLELNAKKIRQLLQ